MEGARVLRMEHLLQPRMLLHFAEDHMWENLPYALLSVGIGLGGILVIFLIKRLLGCILLSRKYREKWVLFEEVEGKKIFRKTSRRRWSSIAHLILEIFFFCGIVIVLWIAAHVAGFNFWTSSMMGVGLGLVGTYVFGTPLQLIGSSIFVYASDLLEEGQYISIAGVEGRIVELHPLGAELEAVDPKYGSALSIHIPMVHFLTQPWIRKYHEEKLMPRTQRNPNEVHKNPDVRIDLDHKKFRGQEYFTGSDTQPTKKAR